MRANLWLDGPAMPRAGVQATAHVGCGESEHRHVWRRRAFVYLTVLLASATACSSCPYGRMCWPSTNEDLRYRASDSTCDTIAVEETNLTDLVGLEQLARPANLFIARNPNLVDVSQAKKVDGLVKLSDNEALKHAKFGTINRLFIIDQSDSEFPDHHLETLSFTPPEPGHGMQLLIRQNGASGSKLKTIQATCATECAALQVSIVAQGGFSGRFELENVKISQLVVDAPFTDIIELQALTVPTEEIQHGPIERELAEAYLEWLRAEGFAGAFSACVFEDVLPETPCTDESRLTSDPL